MTTSSAEEQRLRDLKLLRRVKDRIDRDYAQPLDVEALARGRAPVGRAPEPRVQEGVRRVAVLLPDDAADRAGHDAAAAGRPQRHRRVLRGRLPSLGTFSTRFTELVGVPPSVYKQQAARRAGRRAVVRGQAGHADRSGIEKHGRRPSPSVLAMDINIHTTLPPARRPRRRCRVLLRQARLRAAQRRRLQRHALAHRRPARPARASTWCCSRPGADPGVTEDERRTITEMMAKGTYAMLARHQGPRRHLRGAAGQATSRSCRSRPSSTGACRDCAFRDPSGNMLRIDEVKLT